MKNCLKCNREIFIVNEFDPNAATQGIKAYKCFECNHPTMTYMCQVCYVKWWTAVASESHTEYDYQIFAESIHVSNEHYSVDLV